MVDIKEFRSGILSFLIMDVKHFIKKEKVKVLSFTHSFNPSEKNYEGVLTYEYVEEKTVNKVKTMNKVKIITTDGSGWFSNCIIVSDDNGNIVERYISQGYGSSQEFIDKYGNIELLNIKVTPSVYESLKR